MGKQLRHETPLPAALERVVEVMTDPTAMTHMYEAAEFSRVAVAVRTEGDATVVETDQHMTGPLPGPLARLTGGTVHLTETHAWRPAATGGSRSAGWTVAFHGVPGSIDGTITVRADGAGSLLVHEATVTARIPVIGGRIESLTIDQTVDKLKKEGRWLAEHV